MGGGLKEKSPKRGNGSFLLLFLLGACALLFINSASTWLSSPAPAEKKDWSTVSYEDKWALLDSVISTRVFETDVKLLPVLQPLFEEYNKARKYFIPGIRMGEFDKSCDRIWRDSLSDVPDFDRKFYEDQELKYKVTYLNQTLNPDGLTKRKGGTLKHRKCYGGYRWGCCLRQRLPDACCCKYDGFLDIETTMRTWYNNLPSIKLKSSITRGFSIQHSEESDILQDLYEDVLVALGVKYEKGSDEMDDLSYVKNFSYMPPEGFIMWHTNKYDNLEVSYRMYIINTDKDYGSAFKYLLPNGKMKKVYDFNGAVRLFSNTNVNAKTGEKDFLWHTVYSKANRLSLGFEMHPPQMIALLDGCDGCWDKVEMQRKEIEKDYEI